MTSQGNAGVFLAIAAGALSFMAPAGAAAQQQTTTAPSHAVTPAVPPGYQYSQPFAYPAGGQDGATQMKDTQECHTWAGQQLGFDPRNPYASIPAPAAQQQAEQQTGPDGSAVRGAARGAAAGAMIGAIAGDAGQGAAIGAVSGGLLGRAQSRRTRAAQQQQAEQQARSSQSTQYDAFMQLVGRYDKAYTMCMSARGYTTEEDA